MKDESIIIDGGISSCHAQSEDELVTSPAGAGEESQGGCNGGSGEALPTCPTATGHLTGRVVGDCANGANTAAAAVNKSGTAFAEPTKGETSPDGKTIISKTQIRLVLPRCSAMAMAGLPRRYRGEFLEYMTLMNLSPETEFRTLLSAANQLGRVGILLKQSTRYMESGSDLATCSKQVELAIRRIRKLSPRSSTPDKVGGNGPGKTKLVALKNRGTDIVELRMSVSADFGRSLLSLSPRHRSRLLWLLANSGVTNSTNLRALVRNEHLVVAAGRMLNLALRKAGKEQNLGALAPAVRETLGILDTIFHEPS